MKKVWYVVKMGLTRVTVKALASKVRNTITMMTGNPAFVNPVPSLATVTGIVDKLDAAVQAYDFTRSRLDKDKRDDLFQELKDTYKELGSWVQAESKGDRDLIASAGFETEKERTPIGELPAPGNVKAKATPFNDRLEVRWSAVKGRNMYYLYMCSGDPNEEANWKLAFATTKNRVLVNDLTPYTTYYFRVTAQGAAGVSPASDVAKAVAA